MSIIGKFEKQNRVTFWELLKSIIGNIRSIANRLRPIHCSGASWPGYPEVIAR